MNERGRISLLHKGIPTQVCVFSLFRVSIKLTFKLSMSILNNLIKKKSQIRLFNTFFLFVLENKTFAVIIY